MSPILLLHICSGTAGVLSGFTAVFLDKGSRRHRVAGNVFVIAMLSLGATGVYLAFLKSQPGNILGGALTFYLVASAWMTARHRDKGRSILEWGSLLLVLAIAVVELTFGLQAANSPTRLKYGFPAAPYFVFGAVALLAATGDVRMLIRGGISGAQRLTRHLWRMCFGLFIAAGSVFAARPHLFPVFMRKSGMLILLTVLPLILLVFWLIRVRFAGAYKGKSMPRQGEVYSAPTHIYASAPMTSDARNRTAFSLAGTRGGLPGPAALPPGAMQ
jgi:hypothetical protein